MDRRNRHGLMPPRLAVEPTSEVTSVRGRKLKPGTANRRVRSLSLDVCRQSQHKDCPDGVLPSGVAPVDIFIISRLNDSSSYFFTWFCKRYRIRIGIRDLGGKEEIQRCPICLDPCTKSIELQCGHAFCRACLATSAANNITSCALCRREQVINPELLRARFDEQRMLNLAQRLAIPPPVRSRPSTSVATMSAGGNRERKDMQANALSSQNLGHEEKDLQSGRAGVASRPLNVESMTTRGHLLFGPWGDVGAMSTDDLRRRWKFSSMQTSNAPDAATVGAASAAELRSVWRDVQHLSRAFSYMRNEREVFGTPGQVSRDSQARADVSSCCSGDVSSCSGQAEPLGNEIGPRERNFQVATPDSPCAGGSSLGELSFRWRTLTRASSGRCSSDNDISDEISVGERSSSAKTASVDRKRIAELQIFPDQVSVDASSAPSVLVTPIRSSPVFDDDVGSLAVDCLQTRWRDAFKQGERNVGASDVRALADRFSLVRGSQGVGGASTADLTSRWTAVRSKETVGATEVGTLATRFSLAGGAQGVGDVSNADLRSRWAAARSKETVGTMAVRALAARLSVARGVQGVGDISSADLTSRWTAVRSNETIGATEVRALADKLSLARGAQGVGGVSIADLTSRWTAARSKETVGATEIGSLAARLSLVRSAQGVGDISNADLSSRWTAARSKETVGATEVRALAARLSLARGAQGVGDLPHAGLTSRWTASRSKETVGEMEVRALAARFSLAKGAQGVGDKSNANLTRRWPAARSKETVGATEVRALAARLSLARGAQGVGDMPLADLTRRWTASPSKETVGATDIGALVARFSLARGAQGVGDLSNTDLTSRWTAARSNDENLRHVEQCCARMEEGRGSSGRVGGNMPECKRLTTDVPGWCIVDGTATCSGEVGGTYTLVEKTVGAVSPSVACDSWRTAGKGAAPLG